MRKKLLTMWWQNHLTTHNSLDVTDKDVLEKLILHENARSHIFYRNKDSMAKQIQNLVKIIGEENLIRMTRGSNRSIIFEPISRS